MSINETYPSGGLVGVGFLVPARWRSAKQNDGGRTGLLRGNLRGGWVCEVGRAGSRSRSAKPGQGLSLLCVRGRVR